MRKLFYLIVCLMGLSTISQAQVSRYDTIPSLIISEARLANEWWKFYAELANAGTKDINLDGFKLVLDNESVTDDGGYMTVVLPNKVLKPGETYLVAQKQDWGGGMDWDDHFKNQTQTNRWGPRTMPEFLKAFESGNGHLVRPANGAGTLGTYQRSLRLEYKGVYVDILHGSATGGPDTWVGYVDIYEGQAQYASIAGVPWVWGSQNEHPDRPEYLIVRKTTVKHGNVNWDASRGTDAANSEWIVVPVTPNAYNPFNNRYCPEGGYEWAKYFTTIGNHGNGTINSTTVKSSVYSIDYSELKITVPWGIDRFRIADNMELGPNLSWQYIEKDGRDASYPGVVTGDKLKIFATGSSRQETTFQLVAGAANDATKATVLALSNAFKVTYPGFFYNTTAPDTIYGYGASGYPNYKANVIQYGLRVDSLLKYTESAPGAKKEIVYVDGKTRADLKSGDKLKVSNGGITKEYYLMLATSPVLNADAFLSAIKWPDIPSSLINTPQWNGFDIIPGFNNRLLSYIVKLPPTVSNVPALVAVAQNLNAAISVDPAKSLVGTDAERTTTITVTSENGAYTLQYKVRFDIQKPSALVQTVAADPLFTEFVSNLHYGWWIDNFAEITNPGNAPVNLSNYMIVASPGGTQAKNVIGEVGDRGFAVRRYIPGYVFVEGDEWGAKPGFVKPDAGMNSILGPGESFTVSRRPFTVTTDSWDGAFGAFDKAACTVPLNPLTDVTFGITNILQDPAKYLAEGKTFYEAGHNWYAPLPLWRDGEFISLYKIKNDSITRGLKAVKDPNDFELIDIMGTYDGKKIAPVGIAFDKPPVNEKGRGFVGTWNNWNYYPRTYVRKPGIWKGNPVPGGSWGTPETSEWIEINLYDLMDAGVTAPESWGLDLGRGLKSHDFQPVTDNSSTVLSKLYKVSDGYKSPQTIKGVITGTKVSDFIANVIKKNQGQTLEVINKNPASVLANNDTLLVTSADKSNTTKYVLTVASTGLSSDATLVAKAGSGLTVEVNGTSGTVSGIVLGMPVDLFLTQLTKPAGATWRMTDTSGNLVPNQIPVADGSYSKVKVSEAFVIEVTSENSQTVINYHLKFAGVSDNSAILISSIYPVDQSKNLVTLVEGGISVETFMSRVQVNEGASAMIMDKLGGERPTGLLAADDMVMVTSPDGKVKRAYFLSFTFEGFGAEAYVTSSVMFVDQVAFTIAAVPANTSVEVFYGLLTPAENASMVLLDANNNAVTSGIIHGNYKLRVTSGNKQKVVDYMVTQVVSVGDLGMDVVKVYPNPATDKLRIDGLRENCSVVITSMSGVVKKIVDVNRISNATISVNDLAAGMYMLQITGKDYKSVTVKFVKQ